MMRSGEASAVPPVVGRLPRGDLLPTPSAVRYGSSNNGDPRDGRGQYRLRGKMSLWTRAERGLLPGHPPGPLAAEYVEWLMGFPLEWTDLTGGD